MRIYVASKAKHAAMWVGYIKQDWPILSSWMFHDEADPEVLWTTCVEEARDAEALVLYVEEGELLKGALVEVGVALGAGHPVHVYDPDEVLVEHSWINHPLVSYHGGRWEDLVEALELP